MGQSFLFIAIDISRFVEPDEFKDRFQAWVELLTSSPKRDGFERIYYPGEMVQQWSDAAQVEANIARYNLLDDQVRFLEGWFRDTLPDAPIERIAVLRLDGDLYESTMDALVALEPRVSPGGFVLVDDYNSWEPCARAVDDYRADRGITAPVHAVDWTGVWWRKEPE